MRPKRRASALISLAAAMTAMAARTGASAATSTWTNPAGGNFSDPLNWNNGAGPVPSGGTTAQFSLAQTYTTVVDASPTSGDIEVNGGNATLVTDGTARTWSMSGNLQVDGGNLTLGASAAPLLLSGTGGLANVGFNSTWTLNGGNDFSMTNGIVLVGTGGGGGVTSTVMMDGPGTTLTSGATQIARDGQVARLLLSNGASCSFTGAGDSFATALVGTPGTTAIVSVDSGAHMTTGNMVVSNTSFAGLVSSLSVSGAGSTWTQSGASTFMMGGSGVGASSTLTVSNGGVFSTGTGQVILGKSAKVTVSGGTFNLNYIAATMDGGSILQTVAAPSNAGFVLKQGALLTASNNSQLNITGDYKLPDGCSLVFQSGSDMSVSGALTAGGDFIAGRITVDGSGSTLTAGQFSTLGGNPFASAGLTFRNLATGSIPGLAVGNSNSFPGVLVQTGATVTIGTAGIGQSGGFFVHAGITGNTNNTSSGQIIVGSINANISTLNVPGPMTLGDVDGTGTLSITANGVVNKTGTDALTVRQTGTVAVGGGALHAGTVIINAGGGKFNVTSGGADAGDVTNDGAVALSGGVTHFATLSGTGTSTVSGGGTLSANFIRQNSLTVTTPGAVAINASAANANTSRVNTLTVTGELDLRDNKLIVNNGTVGTRSGSTYTGLTGLIQSGRNGGNWSGNGIITSQTQATTSNLTSIGIATAQQVKGLSTASATAVWAGETVTGNQALVMYTYGGDANLDGKINVDDYGRIDFNVNLGTAGWFNGDYNYDGKINVDDYGIIDFNVGIQGAPFPTSEGVGLNGVTAIPEPASFAWLAACGFANPVRRRRRRRRRAASDA
jgi:hypothetical protein